MTARYDPSVIDRSFRDSKQHLVNITVFWGGTLMRGGKKRKGKFHKIAFSFIV